MSPRLGERFATVVERALAIAAEFPDMGAPHSYGTGGLEHRLYEAIGKWIKSNWLFSSVAFPGRSISLDAWRAIQDERR